MNTRLMFKTITAVAILLVTYALANAQTNRTWVSGVGSDSNPCSRIAPCRTFNAAISLTNAGGEIDVLDPGDFGAVTITKSISIEARSTAGVLVSGTDAIVVSAPAGSFVVLRGLTIDGIGTGLAGIRFLTGGSLQIDDCTINNFTNPGVEFAPNQATASKLIIKDTKIRNGSGPTASGVHVAPVGGGTATAMIDNVLVENCTTGFRVEDNGSVVIRHSIADNNATNGFLVLSNTGATATMTLKDSVLTNNGTNGVKAQGYNASAFIGGNVIRGNAIGGFSVGVGAQIFTTGDNSNLDPANTGSLQPVTAKQ
jgi:hypothetical protein